MGIEPEVIEIQRRRVHPAIIVVAVVVVVAALLIFVVRPLLFPGDEPVTAPPEPRRTPPAVVAPSPAPTETPPPETFEVFESKDPFRPLVLPPGAGGGVPGPGPAPGPGGTPAPGGSPAPGGGAPAPGPGAGGGAAPTGGQRISLLDIFDGKAQVKVAGTVYTVAPGEVFARNFKVVSISGDCATLLMGDDKFTLCKGEEIIK